MKDWKKVWMMKIYQKMDRTSDSTLIGNMATQGMTEQMRRTVGTKEYNVMNVKVMFTSERNVQLFSRSRRKG